CIPFLGEQKVRRGKPIQVGGNPMADLQCQRSASREIIVGEERLIAHKLERLSTLGSDGLRMKPHHPNALAFTAHSGATKLSTFKIRRHKAKERGERRRNPWRESHSASRCSP